MALLDMLRRPFERIGTNLENYMGGLLGENVEDMTPEERRRLRQRAIMAISEGMATMTPVSTTLREAADEEMARRQAQRRMSAAQQASSQIAGRLMGAPAPAFEPDPTKRAAQEAAGARQRAEVRAGIEPSIAQQRASGQLQEFIPTAQYRRDPMDALRMAMTPAGLDAMQINPLLQPMLEQLSKPTEVRPLKFMSGPNGAIFAFDDITGESKELVKAPPPVIKPPGGEATYEGLRKEWTNLTKDYRDIGNMWAKIREAGTNPTAANDMAMIFGYMKILDPGSVVREGEFANARNAAGVPDRVRNLYNQAKDGTMLNPDQRQAFLQSAYGAVKSQIPVLQGLEGQFRNIAAADNLDPNRIIINPLQGALLPMASGIDDPEYEKIPVGALYEGADGVIRRKRARQ